MNNRKFVLIKHLSCNWLQGIVELRRALEVGADKIDELQTLYRQMPPQFVKMASSLPTVPGVCPLSDLISKLQQTNSDWLGNDFRCYRKALELLHAVVCQSAFKNWFWHMLNLCCIVLCIASSMHFCAGNFNLLSCWAVLCLHRIWQVVKMYWLPD